MVISSVIINILYYFSQTKSKEKLNTQVHNRMKMYKKCMAKI